MALTSPAIVPVVALGVTPRLSQSPAPVARDILAPFVTSRLLFILITITAPWWSTLFHLPHIPLLASGDGLSDRWYRWDAQWYMRVATDGYRTIAYSHNHLNLAFFPLYPLLLHLGFQVWPWSHVVAAMAINNLCFVLASYYLYRLVDLDHGRTWARRVMWILAFFPTSLFFFSGYSEGLFLLCLVLCFYHMRLEHWWWASMWGGMAAATRPLGVIVLVPFVVCWYQAQGPTAFTVRPWIHKHLRTVIASALIPLGLAGYMVYLWIRFGNALAFSASQRSWHRTWTWPWNTLGAAITRPMAHAPHLSPDQLHAILDTVWGVVFLAITVLAARSLPRAYLVFLILFWAVILSTPALLDGASDPLISLPRFLATAFPLLIFLAATRRRFLIACTISTPLLVLNTAIFVAGGWVA